MRELLRPKPVDVEVPSLQAEGLSYPIRMQTGFFRERSFVPESLYFASELADDPSDLSVISAACSTGPEAYSILALHKNDGYRGEVTIRGYDINPLAIEGARRGVYTVIESMIEPAPEVRAYQEKALRELGFTTWYGSRDSVDADEEAGPYLKVNAKPLREGHDVEFAQHDLVDPLPATDRADLVLANNVLYHVLNRLGHDKAFRVLRNLAGALANNGVLCLGGGTLDEQTWETDYMIGLLDKEFDLKPLYIEDSALASVPVIFSRS